MSPKNLDNINSFRRISLITVIAVYFLILIGGVVRSTGSGMGCPDWPKCFGSWIPPTSVNQLPNDYQAIYLEKRLEKNEEFVSMLQSLGFSEKAQEIKKDKLILVEQEFNAVKTWIEYINRLIGAVIGILVILTLYKSLPLWNSDKTIPVLAGFNLLLVLFQGWIGSIVVSTNLLQWMITLHMMLALLIVCLLLYIFYRSRKLVYRTMLTTEKPTRLFFILGLGFLMMIVQIVLGTQVREEIDKIAFEYGNMMREQWIENLGLGFIIHRSFSILLLAIHLLFISKVYKYTVRNTNLFQWSQILLFIILLEIVSGVGMAYFGIPAFLQPVHLLLGSLIVGIQFLVLLYINDQQRLITENTGS